MYMREREQRENGSPGPSKNLKQKLKPTTSVKNEISISEKEVASGALP